MRHLSLLLWLSLGGCKWLAGIDDTKVIPDAGKPDAAIDAMPDAPPLPLSIDIGNGADGPVVVETTVFTDDVRTALVDSPGAGGTQLDVASIATFRAGDEVVIIQMTGVDVGHYETHRIASIGADHFVLATPLLAPFDADTARAQVIRVPNYQSLEVKVGGTLAVHPWDSVAGTGGVMVFRASSHVTIAGTVDASGKGFVGGAAGTASAAGGEGATGGFGGGRAICPILCSNFAQGGGGGPGKVEDMAGAAGGGGGVLQMCRGGTGGRGGIANTIAGEAGVVGAPGTGEGAGAGTGEGGKHVGLAIERPALGGGGGAGSSGAGGFGGGGGGGGGGPVTDTANAHGTQGGAGDPGGTGGTGGAGGVGGGLIVVVARSIELSGTITASGSDGVAGAIGGTGGKGGFGGFGSNVTVQNCAGAGIYGGRGGGGQGAAGGQGGQGGGGGAGGSISITVDAITIVDDGVVKGAILSRGGGFGAEGPGGVGGMGGESQNVGAMGSTGAVGLPGLAGDPGHSFIRHLGACTGCTTGDPLVDVMMISGPERDL